MSALRLLALFYLAAASVFIVTAMLAAHIHGAAQAPDDASPVVRLTLAPSVTEPAGRRIASDTGTTSITILPDLTPVPPSPKPHISRVRTRVPEAAPRLGRRKAAHQAQPFHIPDPPPYDPPMLGRRATAAERLNFSLTPEMAQNFDLFLYVSTAARGALAQHMVVFQKQRSGELKLIHDWPASTGRERQEVNHIGRRSFTATPRGYYELDPDRMYRFYHSTSWDQDMPNAMFFNWEREGLQTGLAIHAASGGDIARLGRRASAGCVHLSPENAAALYDLIRANYRGAVPRFAYDGATQTMSNRGEFMHDRAGRLKMAEGYRVLVVIENTSSERQIAELF